MPEGEIAENIAAALGWADIVVVLGAVGVLLVIAYFTGKDEKDTADFFVGSRRVPAIVACLSFVATEISAVTIIAVPAATFSENWMYLQMFIGSAAAKIFVAAFFILSEKGDIEIGWTWLIAIGTAATFILSYITPKNLFDRQLSSDVE